MPARDHPLLGRWRIVEMALWDADFLDLVEPAYIAFDRQGRGEFVFGAVHGSLDCRYGRDSVDFTWQGSDEMDPACGDGDAEPMVARSTARGADRQLFAVDPEGRPRHLSGRSLRAAGLRPARGPAWRGSTARRPFPRPCGRPTRRSSG
jgi:hypothetical protein